MFYPRQSSDPFLEWQASSRQASLRTIQERRSFPDYSLGLSKRRGAIISTARKRELGATIYLCHGFVIEPLTIKMVAHIDEHITPAGFLFAALFPAVEPGNYTLFFEQSSRKLVVTVHAGEIAAVNWCRCRGEVG